ncbi:MAG: hypothetical protein KIT22_01255 [Verrucomicrobiae bacterium]|nr:hypothetical protein [Verrucomicrobiae bacterium]
MGLPEVWVSRSGAIAAFAAVARTALPPAPRTRGGDPQPDQTTAAADGPEVNAGPTFVKAGHWVSTAALGLVARLCHQSWSRLQDEWTLPAFDTVEVGDERLNCSRPWTEVALTEVGSRAARVCVHWTQVHWARLFTDEEVVVKVQRPGIQDKVQTDLDILALPPVCSSIGGRGDARVASGALVEQLRRARAANSSSWTRPGTWCRFTEQFRGGRRPGSGGLP